MKQIAVYCLMLLTAAVARGEFVQDFDHEENAPVNVAAPLAVVAESPFSVPNCLKLELGDKPRSALLPFPVQAVKPGDRLGISFNYRHSAGFKRITVNIQFRDAAGKMIVLESFPLSATNNWGRVEKLAAVPDNPAIAQAVVSVTAGKYPEGEFICFDNLRLALNPDEKEFYVESFQLELFDGWKRRTREQEKFLPGNGGRILMDWQKSKFGESCFESVGKDEPWQYSWRIYNLKISSSNVYNLNFYYNHSENYTASSAMIIVSFRNESGKTLEQENRLMLPKTNDWREAELSIVPPAGAAFMDIAMRLLNVKPDVKIYINRISATCGKPELKTDFTTDPKTRIMTGKVSAFSLPVQTARPKLTVIDSSGKIIAEPPLKEDGQFSLDLSQLPDGPFVLHAEIAGISGETVFHNFNSRPWENRGAGLLKHEAPPPQPWTPVRTDAARLSVETWNPVVEFSPALALKKIKMADSRTDLLQQPLQLLLDGKDIFTTGRAGKVEVAPPSPNHAEFSTVLTVPDLDVRIGARVEFDGMVKYHVVLKADRNLTIHSLDLKYFPAITDYATTIDGSWSTYNILILRDRKNYAARRFYPMLWTGNLSAGLYSAIEKLWPEREYQSDACHNLNFNGEFMTRIVNAPLSLEKDEEYALTFAFGVTPFRPLPEPEKPLRFRAGAYSTFDLLWPSCQMQPYFGYPVSPADPTLIPGWLKKHDKTRNYVYQIPFFCMANLPQYSYFAGEWQEYPERIYPASSTRYPAALINVDIGHASWQDLFLKDYFEYLRENPFAGVYFDCVNIYSKSETDGRFRYKVFPVRDFLQRIYIVQREANPKSWSISHCGAAVTDFCNIFAEIALTGEHYRADLQKHRYYLEFQSLEEFRVQNCGKIGPWRMFMPEFRDESKTKAADIAVHTMGMVLVHNQLLYPSSIRRDIVDHCRNRDYAFYDAGKDNRFQAYWLPGAAETGNRNIVASSQINSYGVLSYYLNSAKTREKAMVALPQNSGHSGAEVTIYDPLTGKSDTARLGDSLDLEPYMFKMVLHGNPAVWEKIDDAP